ncbi:YidC/Oxa1 family membrane protein insertase [Streptomyces sp. 8N616]|uniref:YidC/Oxa1 family membrane protein insertase n=1 Tax=Streptomyces sp. 8N616 TaxID=3457414 RepID=UPI003FD2E693
MSVFTSLGALLAQLADQLHPLFGASATAAAIVLLTLCVRLALHPLARAAVRGEKTRAALAPRMAELQRKYGRDPERLRRAMRELYAEAGASPLAGCLPMLVQLPVFFVMYRLFGGSGAGGGEGSEVLGHALLGAPLGGRWADALAEGGAFGAQGLVYLGLFAAIAVVATWTYVRARKAMAAGPAAGAAGAAGGAAGATGAGPTIGALPGGMTKVLPLLSFGTLVAAAVVPLAAGLYLVTTTAWTAAERAWLQRGDRAPAMARNQVR